MRLTNSIIVTLLDAVLLIGCSGNSKDKIEASGTIEGTDVDVSAEVGGKIKEVRVDEGTPVQSGDTLALISHSSADIELRQAEANAAATEAQYKLVVRGARREDILQAEANFTNAQDDYLRMKQLLESKTVTQKQYDDIQTRFVVAQQTLEKLKRGALSEEIDATRARRDQAIAQVDLVKKRIRDSYIISPTHGIVTLKGVEVGELVGIGTNLFRITYLDKVKLTIYIGEEDLPKVRLGQKASVSVDAYKDRTFEGEVIYKSPVAEFTPKNVQTKEERTKLVYAVKIQVANPEGALSPGLPADARLSVQ